MSLPKRILAGILVFLALVVGGLWALVTWWTGPQLEVTLDVPREVYVGDQFSIRIDTYNPHVDTVELDNVAIPHRAFEFLEVVSVQPAPKNHSPYNVLGLRVWQFDRRVAPGARFVLELHAAAVNAFSGSFELDVCNNYEDCTRLRRPVRIAHRFLEAPTRTAR